MDRTPHLIQKSRERRIFRLYRNSLRYELGLYNLAFTAIDYIYIPNYWLEGLIFRSLWYLHIWIVPVFFKYKRVRSNANTVAAMMLIFICCEVNWLIYRSGGINSYYITGLVLVNAIGLHIIGFSRKWAIGVDMFCFLPTLIIIWLSAGITWNAGITQTAILILAVALAWFCTASERHLIEVNRVLGKFKDFSDQLAEYEKAVTESAKQEVLLTMAKQVAHDIRSPLSVLNMVALGAEPQTEETKNLVRRSIHRIRDIADDLLKKSKTQNLASPAEAYNPQLLVGLIETLLSEKTLQTKPGQVVEYLYQPNADRIFANVRPSDFKRVLSNLINNSLEALRGQGHVSISLIDVNSLVQLTIRDNGKGIPKEILDQLKEKGGSFGKNNGFGLGLSHAKQMLQQWGGKFEIESKEGIGTTVSLLLPLSKKPDWLLSEINLAPGTCIILVDHDSSTQQALSKRVSDLFNQNVSLLTFNNPEEALSWHSKNHTKLAETPSLLITEYEFQKSKETGLTLKEKIKTSQFLLLTHAFDVEKLQQECLVKKIYLMPKPILHRAPIKIS